MIFDQSFLNTLDEQTQVNLSTTLKCTGCESLFLGTCEQINDVLVKCTNLSNANVE